MTDKINVDDTFPKGSVQSAEPETVAERMRRELLANVPALTACLVIGIGMIFGIALSFGSEKIQQSGVQLVTTMVGAAAGYLFASKQQS